LSVLVDVAPPLPFRSGVVQRRRGRGRRLLEGATPYLYLFPACLFLGFFVYKPLIATFQYSFDNWNLVPSSPRIFVGWSNYSTVLRMPAMWEALGVTGMYILGMLTFGVALPLAIGGLTQQVGQRSRAVYRGLIFVPVLVSPIVAATLWNFLLAPNGGLVNRVLSAFGIGAVNWLVHPDSARAAIVLIAGWKIVGFSALIVSAGLAGINSDYYEASAVDGAKRWQVFRKVTLPLLSPTIVFLVITVVLLSSQIIFPLINSLTQGGPTNSTTDIYYFLYSYGFTSFDVGVASAAAVMFFFLFGSIALGLTRLIDRFSFYDN
jgi:multiple sugar transport system permease protein